jgi:hypothetical protein
LKTPSKFAPWIGVAVLVAGIAAFAVTRHGGSSPPPPLPHRKAPISAGELAVAREFVDTAVARKQLARAWEIAAPELKQGLTLDQWKTGSIPVVPYPVGTTQQQYHVVNSFTDTSRISVSFLPRPGSKAGAAAFTLDLHNVGGRWLVSSWQPASSIRPKQGT